MPTTTVIAAMLASTLPLSATLPSPEAAGPAVFSGSAVAAGLAVAAGPPVVVPPSGQVTIEKLKVKGSGCRAETAAVAVSPDRQAFTVIYSTYVAQAGAGSKSKDESRNCSITVQLNVPANLTYAVSAVDYRGFAHLEPGGSATLSARYHFQSSGAPSYTVHSFASGLDEDWQVTDAAGTGAEFGNCGKDRKIDIDTELRAQADRATAPTSLIAMDSTDSEVTSTYHLTYRNC